MNVLFLWQPALQESDIDAGFKALFAKLAGPVRQQEVVNGLLLCPIASLTTHFVLQEMEINVSKLQMILNRVVGKRECADGHVTHISVLLIDNMSHMLWIKLRSYLTLYIPWKEATDV